MRDLILTIYRDHVLCEGSDQAMFYCADDAGTIVRVVRPSQILSPNGGLIADSRNMRIVQGVFMDSEAVVSVLKEASGGGRAFVIPLSNGSTAYFALSTSN